ncbi:MAG: L,D-transpeptidase family protein [Planctomycetota bacterium]
MARFTYGRRKNSLGRLLYPIIALVIFAVIVAVLFGYNPFKKGREKAPDLSVTETSSLKPEEQVSEPQQQDNIEEKVEEKAEEKPQEKPAPEPSKTVVTTKTVPEPNTPPNPNIEKLIDESMKILDENPDRIVEARQLLNDALLITTNPQQQGMLKRTLSELSDQWLFSNKVFPNDNLCGTYRVEPSEQLRNIGRTFNVPYEALMEINKISDASRLQAGQVLKIIHGPFHAIVDRSDFTLDLYLQDTFVKSFLVGLGQENMETPTGLWLVEQGGKLVKPRWTDPISGRTYESDDPDYPLGSRWIALEGLEGDAVGRTGFAIHGTKDPESIGTRSSQGCIRLHNGNVILVYKLLEEGVSKVRIID